MSQIFLQEFHSSTQKIKLEHHIEAKLPNGNIFGHVGMDTIKKVDLLARKSSSKKGELIEIERIKRLNVKK